MELEQNLRASYGSQSRKIYRVIKGKTRKVLTAQCGYGALEYWILDKHPISMRAEYCEQFAGSCIYQNEVYYFNHYIYTKWGCKV
jgi:hypothetical protein